MVCSPSDNSITPPPLGLPPDIGFGGIYAPSQTPFPDISLPEGVPEDILDLLQNIFMRIPGGELRGAADDAFRTVFSAVASLMNQLGPYMALYNFFQALLEMIMCIIDVLCALLNPFATIAAVTRLFKRCMPNFLSLFPFLALLAMILAFIIMLIALIEFLINYIIALINDIIQNIETLSEAFQVGNEEGILAVTQKIASLLCLIEQAFALLIAFQAILAIIENLAALAGRMACRQGEDECCTDEYCPPFIAQSEDGFTGTFGRMIYHKQIDQDVLGAGLPSTFQVPALREERWQFVDDNYESFQFKDIITPVNDNIFWPQPLEFSKGDNINTVVPYTLDTRFFLAPSVFNNNIASATPRYFRAKDVICTIQPYIGVDTSDNQRDFGTEAPSPLTGSSFGNYDGTLRLEGGLIYEDDGTTLVTDTSGVPLTFDTLITQNSSTGTSLPATEDGYEISNMSYTLNINHKVLFKYQLVTAGCQPDVAKETAIIDATTDLRAAIDKIGSLPDIEGALECLETSISKFRENISPETAAVFQDEVIGCLNALKEDAENTYKNTFIAAVSPYDSDVEIDPDVQFVNSPIKITVNLKDPGGNEIGLSIPENTQEEISSLLEGQVTLGNVSDFTYDGYQFFEAEINSSVAGNGELTVSYDGNLFSDIANRDNDDVPTEVQIKRIPYTFVGALRSGEKDGQVRRDESDVANSE